MNPVHTATIDMVEAAYDLDTSPNDWLPNVVASGQPLLDFGLGCIATLSGGVSSSGEAMITQIHTVGPEDLAMRYFSGALELGPDVVVSWGEALTVKGVTALSELEDEWPHVLETIRRTLDCRDGLSVHALDPDGRGAFLAVPTPDILKLTPRDRERWRMLAVHLSAGNRLRSSLLGSPAVPGVPATEMPLEAEVLLDPTRFVVSQAALGARDKAASEHIREAAIRVDRARGRLRKSDPEAALELWHGLVRGRWSLIDWFDTDGRRFVLAKPNAPHLGDPRGLSEPELQVVTYAARGESSKLIGYRFGLSPQRVSVLRRSAMQKLRAKTHAQLVEKMRGLPSPTADAETRGESS